MIAYLFYNRETPAEGQMRDLATELTKNEVEVELVDADSPRGTSLVEYYDILGRPAVLLARRDGSVVQAWQGLEQIPLIADISYMAHQ